MAKHMHIDARAIATCVEKMRATRPHVHCITNTVAQNFTANVLLASGMTPSMTVAAEEMEGFLSLADALLINVGTMDEGRRAAIDEATTLAAKRNLPWLRDPVFAQSTEPRLDLAKSLLQQTPTAMRCNPGEARALLGLDMTNEALPLLSHSTGVALALTGAEDHVAVGDATAIIRNGSPVMDRVTAMGCALSAVMAGVLAVEKDRCMALTSALVFYGLAGSEAEANSAGPGSFIPAFQDALHTLSPDDILAGARIA